MADFISQSPPPAPSPRDLLQPMDLSAAEKTPDNHHDNLPDTTSTNNQHNQVSKVVLHSIPIVSLHMEGQERLCLAQISNTLLREYSYNEIHNRRVALGITCVQCTPVQLEILRRAGAMPISSRRCGMITLREAERLVKSFLEEHLPPKLPENFVFHVAHTCGWGCKGHFLPSRYNSSRAKCIKCTYCNAFFSPNKFIFHFHRSPDAKYRHPDAANFNSWRRHLHLDYPCDSIDLEHAWEDVKAMFNGGSRKRTSAVLSPSSSPTTVDQTSPDSPHKRPRIVPVNRSFNGRENLQYARPTALPSHPFPPQYPAMHPFLHRSSPAVDVPTLPQSCPKLNYVDLWRSRRFSPTYIQPLGLMLNNQLEAAQKIDHQNNYLSLLQNSQSFRNFLPSRLMVDTATRALQSAFRPVGPFAYPPMYTSPTYPQQPMWPSNNAELDNRNRKGLSSNMPDVMPVLSEPDQQGADDEDDDKSEKKDDSSKTQRCDVTRGNPQSNITESRSEDTTYGVSSPADPHSSCGSPEGPISPGSAEHCDTFADKLDTLSRDAVQNTLLRMISARNQAENKMQEIKSPLESVHVGQKMMEDRNANSSLEPHFHGYTAVRAPELSPE